MSEPRNDGRATTSMVLGIIGLLAWVIPLFGLPINVVGLVLGILSRQAANRKTAVAGIVMCIIGLVLTVINSAIGAYLGATGR